MWPEGCRETYLTGIDGEESLGTFNGFTTRLLARNLPAATIHTIDLPEDPGSDLGVGAIPKDDFHLIESRRVGIQYRSDSTIANVVQHFGDTAAFDFAIGGPVDLFFIDGSHTYEYVRSDTERALAAARHSATLLWHDCNAGHPGVVRWLAEMVTAGYPVRRISGTNLAVMDSN